MLQPAYHEHRLPGASIAPELIVTDFPRGFPKVISTSIFIQCPASTSTERVLAASTTSDQQRCSCPITE
jgi:hypothetical protein